MKANNTNKIDKAFAIIFIRSHMHDALQTEYLVKDDPYALSDKPWSIISPTMSLYTCHRWSTISLIFDLRL